MGHDITQTSHIHTKKIYTCNISNVIHGPWYNATSLGYLGIVQINAAATRGSEWIEETLRRLSRIFCQQKKIISKWYIFYISNAFLSINND